MKPTKISYTAPKGAGLPDSHELHGHTFARGAKPVLTVDQQLIDSARRLGSLNVEEPAPEADPHAKADKEKSRAAQKKAKGSKGSKGGKKPKGKKKAKPAASGGGGGAERANARLGSKMRGARNG